MTSVCNEIQRLVCPTHGRTAVMAPGRGALDYDSLWTQIEVLAGDLSRLGLQRHDAVALVMPAGPEMLTVFLAVTQVAICAPLNPAFREQELKFYLSDLRAWALIVQAGAESPAVAVATGMGIPVLMAVPEERGPAGAVTLRRLDATSASGGSDYEPDTALLLHTSATTGQPKLVPITHPQLIAMVAMIRESLPEADEGRILSITPQFHIQCILSQLVQLFSGGAIVCTPGLRAESFLDWMRQFRPTQYTANPTLHRAILSLLPSGRPDESFRSMRFVSSAGGPLPEPLRREIEDRLGVPVIDEYGLTEAGRVTMTALDRRRRKAGSVGKCFGVEVAITDEDGNCLRPGCGGEILLRGPTVMKAYAHNPDANRQAFRNGWFRTGDLGHFDDEGFLFITGRLKEMINRGGEKILPYEIEEALLRHPAVKEAAVFGFPHQRLGEDVGAAIVVRTGMSVTALDLRRMVYDHLADYKVPHQIVFVKEIPRGQTGKYQRARMTEYLRVQQGTAAERTAELDSLDPVEVLLAGIWADMLGVCPIGRFDDFFALGGDSLLAVEMLARVEKECDCRIELGELASSGTLASLAAAVRAVRGERIEEHGGDAGLHASRLVPLQTRGRGTPLFLVDPWSDGALLYRDLVRHLGSSRPLYQVEYRWRDESEISLPLEARAGHCVAKIRQAQPHGPYWLAGYSLGGFFAAEMARQLAAAGEMVGGLVIVDSDYFRGHPRAWGRAWLRTQSFVQRISWHVRNLAALRGRAQVAYVRTRLTRLAARRRNSLPTSDRAFHAVIRSHPQHPIPVPALLLCCAEGARRRRNRLVRIWSKTITGRLLIRDVPGNHLSIMREAHVQQVATEILRYVDGAQSHARMLTGEGCS